MTALAAHPFSKETKLLALRGAAPTFYHGATPEGIFCFARPRYPELYEELMGHFREYSAAILNGSPGIGKSTFFVYLLWRCLSEGEEGFSHIIYASVHQKQTAVISVQDRQATVYKGIGLVGDLLSQHEELQKSRLLYICEVGDADNPAEFFRKQNICTLVFTSPKTKHFSTFRKEVGAEMFYMPVWSLEELLEAHRFLQAEAVLQPMTPEDVQARFAMMGGTFRKLLCWRRDTVETPENYIRDKIASAKSLYKLIRGAVTGHYKPSIGGNHLLHMRVMPSSRFRAFQFDFASPYVAEQVMSVKKLEEVEDIEKWVNSSNTFEAATLCGFLFERLGHLKLPKGGQFAIRSLETPAVEQMADGSLPIKDGQISIPQRGSVRFDSLLAGSLRDTDKYYAPKNRALPAVDCMSPPSTLWQITMSKLQMPSSHPVDYPGLKKALLAMGVPQGSLVDLVFVVPSYPSHRVDLAMVQKQAMKGVLVEPDTGALINSATKQQLMACLKQMAPSARVSRSTKVDELRTALRTVLEQEPSKTAEVVEVLSARAAAGNWQVRQWVMQFP
jgi:hypothetical protein